MRGSVMGKLVPGGRTHKTWCELWAVWVDETASNAPAETGDRCTCDELTLEDMLEWWGSPVRVGLTSTA